jgi:hypothetical protein
MYDAKKKCTLVHLNRAKTDKRQDTKTDVFQERYFKLKLITKENYMHFQFNHGCVLWSRVSNSC